jgi:hypothetical protein
MKKQLMKNLIVEILMTFELLIFSSTYMIFLVLPDILRKIIL